MGHSLEKLAAMALKADIAAKEAKERADEAKADFVLALEASDKYNASTKAVGNVRTKITPNRKFNVDKAFAALPEDVQSEVLVAKPDPKLVKQNLTPKQAEEFMEDYSNPFKLSLEVLDD